MSPLDYPRRRHAERAALLRAAAQAQAQRVAVDAYRHALERYDELDADEVAEDSAIAAEQLRLDATIAEAEAEAEDCGRDAAARAWIEYGDTVLRHFCESDWLEDATAALGEGAPLELVQIWCEGAVAWVGEKLEDET